MGTLRTLFALAVALGHLGAPWGFQPMNGNVAVQSFYIVSGFYMTMIYNEKYAAYANAKTVFWLNRYLRLAPAFVLIALATYLASGLGILAEFDVSALVLVSLSQLTMIGLDVFTFLGFDRADGSFFLLKHFLTPPSGTRVSVAEIMPVPQGWTLGLETWFYLLVPFLVIRPPRVILAVLACSFALHIGGFYGLGLKGDPWTYRFFPFELAIFLLGSLAYHGLKGLRQRTQRMRHAPAIFVVFVLLTVFYYYLPGGKTERSWTFLVLFAAAVPVIFQLTKDWVIDRWIGDFSYPIYIAHLLCFRLVPNIGGPLWSPLIKLAIMLVSAFVIVIAIEHPLDRFRYALARQIGRRRTVVVAAAPAISS
jgi:peptidoglycan/LPS O-acetylase OafA/YrhL